MTKFNKEIKSRLILNQKNKKLIKISKNFMKETTRPKYSYNFSWLGRPIIQYPQDVIAMQEIIWRVKPDLIIETGIAHGGSVILSASMLAMIEIDLAKKKKKFFDANKPKRKVLAIDVDIRKHNLKAIKKHSMYPRIELIQGSSVDNKIVKKVKNFAKKFKRIMVFLDSNHTHEHVLNELELYAPLVSKGSYCVVFDTIIEYLPKTFYPNRSWGPGNNPKTAIISYLKKNSRFKIDKEINNKLMISVSPDGYLFRK